MGVPKATKRGNQKIVKINIIERGKRKEEIESRNGEGEDDELEDEEHSRRRMT